MLVREAMTEPVVTIPPDATVRQAIRVLNEHGITALPVVDAGGSLVGIVSEMDLLRGAFQNDPRAFARPVTTEPDESPPRRVDEVMTAQVRTARPTSDVAEVAEMMMRSGIKSVPVLDGVVLDGVVLVGILSRRDLIAVLARSDALIRDDVLASLAGLCPQGRSWAVSVHDGVVRLRGPVDDNARQIAQTLTRTVPGVTRVFLDVAEDN